MNTEVIVEMQTLDRSSASQRILDTVAGFGEEDLRDIYRELFPEKERAASETPTKDALLHEIRTALVEGIEPEQIVDLWHAVFPGDRRIYFDESDSLLHFDAPVLDERFA